MPADNPDTTTTAIPQLLCTTTILPPRRRGFRQYGLSPLGLWSIAQGLQARASGADGGPSARHYVGRMRRKAADRSQDSGKPGHRLDMPPAATFTGHHHVYLFPQVPRPIMCATVSHLRRYALPGSAMSITGTVCPRRCPSAGWANELHRVAGRGLHAT